MAVTYESLANVTLASTATSVTFSSISQNYTDLIIVCQVQSSGGNTNVTCQFNSDTGTNYSTTVLYGTGGSAASTRLSNESIIRADYQATVTTTTWNNDYIYIQNYSNTTTYKTALCRGNNSAQGVDATVGLWRSTAAISTVAVKSINANSFAAGSTFALYGIKAA